MYVRFLRANYPVTVYVANKALEKADVEGITAAVVSAMKDELEVSEWQDKLVGCALDGAAVNIGRLRGVGARLKSDNAEHLIVIHCCAHRLELAVRDVIKKNKYMETIDDFLVTIYKFYENSPLNLSGLKLSGEALGVPALKPVNVLGTRWLPRHQRAVEVLLRIWLPLVTHLHQVSISGSRVSKETTPGLLKTLKSPKFIMYLNFLNTYLKHLASLSKVFQDNQYTVETVVSKIEVVKTRLEQLCDEDKLEEVISKDRTKTDSDVYKFRGTPLTVEGHTRTTRSDSPALHVNNEASEVVRETLQNIDKRFESFIQDPVVASFRMFDPQNWPHDPQSLETYGEENIQLLYHYFSVILEKKGYDAQEAALEWIDLKKHIRRLQAVNKSPFPF